MKKIIFETIVTFCIFFSIWFGLSKIDWIRIFDINEIGTKTEEKLGEITWKYFSDSSSEINEKEITTVLDSLVHHINKANGIDNDFIKLHIVNTDEINAFALPDGHLVLNSQLIIDAKNQEEVLGVISHELAHIQLNHISEKLATDIGITVVIAAVTGSNNEVIGEIVQTLSSTAFDRKNEEEADLMAVYYLENANINPLPFADFLYRLSDNDSESKYLTWLSTHPNSKERSKTVLKKINKKQRDYTKVIKESTWKNLQQQLLEYN